MSVLTRRQLLQAGAAASALAHGGLATAATQAGIGSWAAIDLLLVDSRLEVATAVAEAAVRAKVRVLPLSRDVLTLWHEQLLPVVRTGGKSFAGITTVRGLFLLQTLSADHRLQLTFIAEHSPGASGAADQWIAAKPDVTYGLESVNPVSWIISGSST
jgi:hypothetical protein